ncbi:transcription initiation factor TFIID subunit A-domain-containing protein [Coprinopsis sp. MPI-PUGE-AT-0042]|nr:transcription initiation factor TFIID subunit A-domain-containing protein [Coprinopsis sp. MPI-PUGE-AT-0042]
MENAIAAAAVQAGLAPATAHNSAQAVAAAAAGTSVAGGAGSSSSSANQSTEIAKSIETIMKQQFGDSYKIETIAGILQKNMGHFAKQGNLTPAQIAQLQTFADKHMQDKSRVQAQPQQQAYQQQAYQQQPQQQQQTAQQVAQAAIQAQASATNYAAMRPGDAQTKLIADIKPEASYPPIAQNLSHAVNPGPVTWTPTRPTLTGGLAAGRVSSTPAQVARAPEDTVMLNMDDNRNRRKNSANDTNMRRTIQDLVASVDPNVKVESEVEDLLLNIADEFIDSVTNFACRLAKHRGGDTLEVRDLQLHLERNHNIRIPGFASDETQISLSQSGLGPAAPTALGKKNAQGQHTTLRAQRLAQVQQAKREAKLM